MQFMKSMCIIGAVCKIKMSEMLDKFSSNSLSLAGENSAIYNKPLNCSNERQ